MTNHVRRGSCICGAAPYAGTCMDLKSREALHNAGKRAKYTRSRLPIRIVYSEEYDTLSEARKREAKVKTWTKAEKENLAKSKHAT